MAERKARRRGKRRPPYHDSLTSDPGRRGPLRRLWDRLTGRRLVSTRPPGSDGWFGPPDDAGGAGVREPRRPLPRSPLGAADLPRD
ncbi:MAG TPA: hypothetical protein VK894_09565 [Jiangellales bacterium]|nr:hypothetical protein [Jiangellales bacterium]